MSGMNGMNFHSSGMILNVSEWGERHFHDVINRTCIYHNLNNNLTELCGFNARKFLEIAVFRTVFLHDKENSFLIYVSLS